VPIGSFIKKLDNSELYRQHVIYCV